MQYLWRHGQGDGVKPIALLTLILAACLSACNTTGIATSQPAIIVKEVNVYLTVNVPPGAVPVTVQPGAFVLNASSTINASHLLGQTRPAN